MANLLKNLGLWLGLIIVFIFMDHNIRPFVKHSNSTIEFLYALVLQLVALLSACFLLYRLNRDLSSQKIVLRITLLSLTGIVGFVMCALAMLVYGIESGIDSL